MAKILNTLTVGSKIIFNGHEWVILEHDSNKGTLVRSTLSYGKITRGTPPFNQSSSGSYVRGLINRFSAQDQAIINTVTWDSGQVRWDGSEYSYSPDSSYTSKIGLVSTLQYSKLRRLISGDSGMCPTSVNDQYGTRWITYTSIPTDGLATPSNVSTDNIYPSVYLVPTTEVADNGTIYTGEVKEKIKDKMPGSVISFANSLWMILDPTKGYLFKLESVASMVYDSGNYEKNKASFDPSRSGNIAYWLNNTFYHQLSDEDKLLIKSSVWDDIHWPYNEEIVNANIALLSRKEWMQYSKHYQPESGILDNPPTGFWLRTKNTQPNDYNLHTPSYVTSAGNDANANPYTFQGADDKLAVRPAMYINPEVVIKNGVVVHNAEPTLTLNTPNNITLYENDTFKIDGTALETDIGDIVNVYYRIDGGTSRAVATGISTGASIPFNEQLTFKGGILYKGNTAITSALAEGAAHKLEVWAQDNQDGISDVIERTFYVVPNRAPSLTVDSFDDLSDLINADTITFTGSTHDPDGNDMVVSYKLNSGLNTEIYRGKDGDWSFDLLLRDLKDGENTIVVETVDAYHYKTSKTIKLNKQSNSTPVNKSVQRYKVIPPSGSAQGVLLWVQRHPLQDVTAEISMTSGSEQEQFVSLSPENSAPVGGDIEDYFKHRAETPAENIVLKLSWTGDKPITMISGALLQ